MIQRIQSVYLALAALLGASLAVGTVATYVSPMGITTTLGTSSTVVNASAQVLESSINTSIVASVVVIVAMALFSLFSFKNRKTQQLLCNTGTVLSLFATLYLASTNNKLMEENSMSTFMVSNFRLFTPLICMMLFILAQRAIKKDDDLVKSADRLR
jgi:4-amino-4-deoxy-L-arabinose transferase-like glycosyltransferase